jgi:uncharacterized protein
VLARGGEELTVTAVLKPRPCETSADAEVLYRSVAVDRARRRVIVTRPKAAAERHPAVVLMGGLGCYSLDGELTRSTGYGPILGALAKRWFVAMRVEKTGEGDSEGDSEGPPCTDDRATAEREARGYVAGCGRSKVTSLWIRTACLCSRTAWVHSSALCGGSAR